MNKYKSLSLLVAATVLLAACAGPAASVQPTGEPTRPPTTQPASPTPPRSSASLPNGVKAAIAQQLGLAPEAIAITFAEQSEWPDACLGLPAEGEACAEVITPGYGGMLEANGVQYEFRSDETGGVVRLIPGAALSARQILAQQLKIDLTAIRITSAEEVEWPDGCLGIRIEEMACIQIVTLGYKVVLEAEGKRYEYHTDETGANVVLAAIETSRGRLDASDGPILAWHREGGIAGFCDDLSVYLTGDVFAASCKGNQPTNLGYARLTAEQLAPMYAWIDRLKSFEFERTDPAKADQMTIRIDFSGAGSVDATDADIQAIQQFAADLFAGPSQQ